MSKGSGRTFECKRCYKKQTFTAGTNLTPRDTAIKKGWYLPDPMQSRGYCTDHAPRPSADEFVAREC
jgi:hypothetical protein